MKKILRLLFKYAYNKELKRMEKFYTDQINALIEQRNSYRNLLELYKIIHK